MQKIKLMKVNFLVKRIEIGIIQKNIHVAQFRRT